MLHDAETTEVKTFNEFWTLVKPIVSDLGLVLWDPAVPATANVASTICGVDRCLPVKFEPGKGSLYRFLLDEGIEVKTNLVGLFKEPDRGYFITVDGTTFVSSGSSKCDAYLWALKRYGDRCSDKMFAYVLDGASTIPSHRIYQTYGAPGPDVNQILSHDYLIQNKCFFFDLSPGIKNRTYPKICPDWATRIRTWKCWSQSPVPYRLAIAHCIAVPFQTTNRLYTIHFYFARTNLKKSSLPAHRPLPGALSICFP